MTITTDPRDLGEVFGGVRADENGGLRVGLGINEATLRRNLASAAHAYGWMVEEEVVVPGWGRIDIIIRDGRSAPTLIELKLDLTKPAGIRRAFQQTDGYGRWWAQERGEAVDTLLVGAQIDAAAMALVHRAYPHVGWCNAGALLAEFADRGDLEARILRRRRCVDRLAEMRGIVSAYEAAREALPADPVYDVLGAFNLFEHIISTPGRAS